MAVENAEPEGVSRRNRLADFLARKYRQVDREALLLRLGVDPEECLLNAVTPEDEAWRMVKWFEHRGRLAELERLVLVGQLRRWSRRLSLASLPM